LAPKTTIVVPCYNEAERLDRAAYRAFVGSESPVGFLFVDDGSADDTGRILTDLAVAMGHRAEVLRLPQNRGKAEAVRSGLLAAIDDGADIVGYWDADLATRLVQVDPVRSILWARDEVDIAVGSRVRLRGRHVDRKAMRHYAGRIFATAASIVCRLPIYDTQCGAKLLRVTDDTRAILSEPFQTRWTFDVELLTRYERRATSEGRDASREIREQPLEEWRDIAGSKLRLWDFAVAGFDLVRIWSEYRKVRRDPVDE